MCAGAPGMTSPFRVSHIHMPRAITIQFHLSLRVGHDDGPQLEVKLNCVSRHAVLVGNKFWPGSGPCRFGFCQFDHCLPILAYKSPCEHSGRRYACCRPAPTSDRAVTSFSRMSHRLSGFSETSLLFSVPGRPLQVSPRLAARRHQAVMKLAAQNPHSQGSQSSRSSTRKEPLEVVSRIAACVEMNVRSKCKQQSQRRLQLSGSSGGLVILTDLFIVQAAVSRFETIAGRTAMVSMSSIQKLRLLHSFLVHHPVELI